MCLYLAWRFGQHDPYRLYHYGKPEALKSPPHPKRVQALIYAFAIHAREEEIELAKAVAGG